MRRSIPQSLVLRSFAARGCATTAAAGASPQQPASASSPSSASSSSSSSQDHREALIFALLQRDKEIFTLKRQHELSMLRVEQHQNRILRDQEDRAVYYEQNCNVHTFDTISVGLYSQRNTLYHTLSMERLRQTKIVLMIAATATVWSYLYLRYTNNPNMIYLPEGVVFGSRSLAVKEVKMKQQEEEERKKSVGY